MGEVFYFVLIDAFHLFKYVILTALLAVAFLLFSLISILIEF